MGHCSMSSNPPRCAAAVPAHLRILGPPQHEGFLQEGSAGGQSFVQALRLPQLLLQGLHLLLLFLLLHLSTHRGRRQFPVKL